MLREGAGRGGELAKGPAIWGWCNAGNDCALWFISVRRAKKKKKHKKESKRPTTQTKINLIFPAHPISGSCPFFLWRLQLKLKLWKVAAAFPFPFPFPFPFCCIAFSPTVITFCMAFHHRLSAPSFCIIRLAAAMAPKSRQYLFLFHGPTCPFFQP